MIHLKSKLNLAVLEVRLYVEDYQFNGIGLVAGPKEDIGCEYYYPRVGFCMAEQEYILHTLRPSFRELKSFEVHLFWPRGRIEYSETINEIDEDGDPKGLHKSVRTRKNHLESIVTGHLNEETDTVGEDHCLWIVESRICIRR